MHRFSQRDARSAKRGFAIVIPNTHRRRRRNSTVELSCVGGVYAAVGCRDPVYNSAAIRLRCRQICSDSSRLSPTSCEFNTHRRHNSTRQLSCVGGVYWV